jgi:four helix bundle protein
MPFKFESLEIWKKALELSNQIDKMTKAFPAEERFSLASQVKRAADSVVLNIAEGSTGQTDPEYKRFLNMALRSAIEVVACLFIARSREYVNEESFRKYYNEYEILCKQITTFRDRL